MAFSTGLGTIVAKRLPAGLQRYPAFGISPESICCEAETLVGRKRGKMTFSNDSRKKFPLPKIFAKEEKKTSKADEVSVSRSVDYQGSPRHSPPSPVIRKSFSANSRLGSFILRDYSRPSSTTVTTEAFRIFVATWNAGGNTPHDGIDLNDFLPADDHSDIYVLGFQEIVPLNAGNVLVIEDIEPAVKWLSLINQALNGPSEADIESNSCRLSSHTDAFSPENSIAKISASRELKIPGGPLFFQKPSLKAVSKTFRNDQGRRLKACNCSSDGARKFYRESCFKCRNAYTNDDESSDEEEEESSRYSFAETITDKVKSQQKYSLIACKQMVGIFVTIWVRRELVQHIGHLRVSCVGRGILGYLGNKGCISVSMSLYQTSFCFVCSHLASGEKEGDELRRNSDVIEILKNTQFRRICIRPNRKIPHKILEHDRVIWLGDLNYRIALSYSETKKLLEQNNWDALFKNDQLKIEREAGRVFKGWKEEKICFAPTYKYSYNSDSYAGETVTSKKKRRTPAWCDRILWHGDGILQLSYIRGESKFSDHRPVCAAFIVEVEVTDGSLKKGLHTANMKVGAEELLPPSTSCLPNNKKS